jgi:FKBP-type peptidyl-prolyl cis-trans isomerase
MQYIIGVIVALLLIGGGAYYYFANPSASVPTTDVTSTDQPATSGEQVQGQDVTVGTGDAAAPGSVVTLEYEGRFQDGTVFDSSASHGQPLTFQLGQPGIIPGFQIGVNGMKIGGERNIAIPPALGYGGEDIKDPEGKVLIPANSTLIFNVKLLKVEAAPADAGTGQE